MWRRAPLDEEARARLAGARVLLVRPCCGAEPSLEDNLVSAAAARRSFDPEVSLCVADPRDSTLPQLVSAGAALRERGLTADVRVYEPIGPNRKVAQLAGAVRDAERAGQRPDVILCVDSDVDLDGVDLDAMVAPLLAGELDATWAPFVEHGSETRGDRASRAVLSSTLHAFVVLAGIDERSLVGKCFALRADALAEVGGFEALAAHLGEDVELSRRLQRAGRRVAPAPVAPRSRASGRSFSAAVARYARWIAVVRAQRPALMLTYPMLFFGAPLVALGAAAAALWGATSPALLAGVAAPALLLRAVLAHAGRRHAGIEHGSPLGDALLGDATIALAFARALLSREIAWRGRRFRVERGGELAPSGPSTLLGLRPLLARLIERWAGGYRQQIAEVDPEAPMKLGGMTRRNVAVIGGGIAGITTASTLAERGFDVTLFDKNPYLGGKIGCWRERLDDGFEAEIEHGFHAFFRHYYNLDAFLDRLGLRASMRSVGDYLILERDGKQLGFRDVDTAPLLNMFSMARAGVFGWREILASRPTMDNMDALLRYDPDETFDKLDHISFAEFAERAQLPRRLRLAFTTFSRAFFAEERRMSMAELIKSFHFYYLSNDAGLIYDYPPDDYESALIGPLREHLVDAGVRLRLGEAVGALAPRDDGAIDVDGARFDHVVLACDVVGASAIAKASPELARRFPAFSEQLGAMRSSQRYAVLRVWSDRDLRREMPVFAITERDRVLDALAVCSRVASSARRWVDENGGSVYELHSYALPDDIPDADVARLLLEEAEMHFPELVGQTVRHQHLQINDNFAAFHVGMAKSRPGVETEVPGLLLAGDWVALPRPAMLMEAACMSGLLASNHVLAACGLRAEPIYAVPARGLLAGWPTPPKKFPIEASAPSAEGARQRPLREAG